MDDRQERLHGFVVEGTADAQELWTLLFDGIRAVPSA